MLSALSPGDAATNGEAHLDQSAAGRAGASVIIAKRRKTSQPTETAQIPIPEYQPNAENTAAALEAAITTFGSTDGLIRTLLNLTDREQFDLACECVKVWRLGEGASIRAQLVYALLTGERLDKLFKRQPRVIRERLRNYSARMPKLTDSQIKQGEALMRQGIPQLNAAEIVGTSSAALSGGIRRRAASAGERQAAARDATLRRAAAQASKQLDDGAQLAAVAASLSAKTGLPITEDDALAIAAASDDGLPLPWPSDPRRAQAAALAADGKTPLEVEEATGIPAGDVFDELLRSRAGTDD